MVQRLINKSMLDGKKQASERAVYAAIEGAAKKLKSENPVEVLEKAIKASNPIKWMNYDYQKNIKKEEEKPVIEEEITPTIYLYNSHQTEEYAPSNYAEFSVNPTVMMNDYIQ